MKLRVRVEGIPVTKGSYRAIAMQNKSTGRWFGQLIDSSSDKHKSQLREWKKAIRRQLEGIDPPESWLNTETPMEVRAVWWLPRTSGQKYRRPSKRGADLDKLTRVLWDVVSECGVWADDSQVCAHIEEKRWAEIDGSPIPPGVTFVISELREEKLL